MLGDLAGEAYAQGQQEAQEVWQETLNDADARHLLREGRALVGEIRTEVRNVWQGVKDETQLRDLGAEALADAWRDAVLLWAEETGTRRLGEAGWETVHDAREEAQAALDIALRAYEARQQARAWDGMTADLQTLLEQLDHLPGADGARGAVRVELWERQRDRGLGV